MLLSLSNRKYPPFPLFSYFPVVVCLRYLLHHILSLVIYTFRENREFFSLVLCSLWWVQIFGYVLACGLYSFVCTLHHLIIIIVQTLSEDTELIMPVRYNLSSVNKIKHILSVVHYTICGAVCFQFTHFLRDDWENIHTLSYHHHQIGSMNYYPLFRVRSWNNCMRVCLSIFLYMWESLTCSGGESIPGACITRNFTYLARGQSNTRFLTCQWIVMYPQNKAECNLYCPYSWATLCVCRQSR